MSNDITGSAPLSVDIAARSAVPARSRERKWGRGLAGHAAAPG